MRKLALFLCTAFLAFGADDPWAKLKELKTGTELRVYKKGAAQPLLVKMDELTDDNLVVINKNEQTAIPRDQIDRVDYRPSGKSRHQGKHHQGQRRSGRPESRDPGSQRQDPPARPPPRPAACRSARKPDFETIFSVPRRLPRRKTEARIDVTLRS